MKSKLSRLFACILCCIVLSGAAFGQSDSKEGEEAEAGKSYVQSYFIVGMGIALGLVAICKSAGRRKKVKAPE